MKRLSFIILVFLVPTQILVYGQEIKNQFNFPKSRMGIFSQAWYNSINSQDISYLKPYLEGDKDSEMMMSLFMNHANKVEGISPEMISYETLEAISIYSKENKGGWVKVNLGLQLDGQIMDLSIKKSYKPYDYDQRSELNHLQSKTILDAIVKEITDNYVVKSKRTEFSKALIDSFQTKKYDTISQGDLFAHKITKLLVSIAKDKHLQIISPAEKEQIKVRFKNSETEDDSNTNLSKSFIEFKKINHEIGYIEIERFVTSREQYMAIEKALKEFKDSKAIIIDLRNSGGGDGEAVGHLLSYFFDSKQFVSKSIDDNGDVTEQFTRPNKLSNLLSTKPIYVLTSNKTISASEAFAYFLKSKERAVIIGETTAGAGFMVDAFELPYGFYFVNSIFSPFEYKKGEGWQGSGVRPNYEVTKKQAMDKAVELIQQK